MAGPANSPTPSHGSPEEPGGRGLPENADEQIRGQAGTMAGGLHYLKFLELLHARLVPRLYLEIGVRAGHSLALSRCPAIGIDPAFAIKVPLKGEIALYRERSDDFFSRDDLASVIPERVDLAFIDGLHVVEQVVRDFSAIEPLMSVDGVIVIDDVLPRTPAEATRMRAADQRSWTGDVWKIVPCLQRFRPDLELIIVDTAPTGLLLVTRLDPKHTVLRDRYATIAKLYGARSGLELPAHVIERRAALAPEAALAMLAPRS